MADDIDQSTVDTAGVGSPALTGEIARVRADRSAAGAQEADLLKRQEAGVQKQETTMQERSAAAQPIREQIMATDARRPSAQVHEDRIPGYERPKMDPKELQNTMAVLTIATALIGAASRTPFFGAMEGMKGAMDGFVAGDEARVKESITAYDKNVAAIKANNEAKRREVAAAIADNQNDVAAMKRKLELTLVKYDDQINLQALRTQPINDALKRIQDKEKQDDTLIAHLLQTQASLQSWEYRGANARGGRGVTPTESDKKTALALISDDPRFSKMDDSDRVSLAASVAAQAKSLTISKKAADFDEGVEMAIDALIQAGRLKPGAKKPWYQPDDPATFRPSGAPASAQPGDGGARGDLRQQARDAISNGKDPAAVKKRYKEMTGEDLGGV